MSMKGFCGKIWKGIMKHKMKFVIGVLVLGGAGYYFGVYRPAQSAGEATAEVRTGTVERGDLHVMVTGSGQVYARDEVALKPVAAGDAIEVLSVHVENDQEVKEGDLIAVLDTSDAVKSVRDAELSLWNAEIKMDQTEELYDSETKEDRQARQLQEIPLTQARNKLADTKEELEDYYIRAPFDGVVTGLSVSAGDSVSRDDTITSVISNEMYAQVSLNEVDAVGVEVGDPVTLSFTALDDATVTGEISKIDTIGTVSQGVVSYDAEISFDSASLAKLKPGMSVDVEIATEEKIGVLSVPIAAVGTGPGGGSYVMTLSDDGEYHRTRVEMGISTDTAIEIVNGLSEGDTIALNAESASDTSGQSGNTESGERQSSGLMGVPGMGGGAGMGGGRPPGN
jgi:RND family efflux transporter MFP subunit